MKAMRLLILTSLLAALHARAAVVTWTNASGGLWSAGTNWGTGTAPGASDDVFITAAGDYTVTQNVHVTIASLTLGGGSGTQTLTNTVGNLTLNGASAVNPNGVFGFGGGTLAGAGGMTVGGQVVWTGGTLGNGAMTIATNGVLNITGSATKELNGTGTLMNYGSIAWSGTNDILMGNSARIINQPGALFDIQNNQLLSIYNGGAITNLGTIRKSAGGGSTVITVPLNNFGTLDVQSGSIRYGASVGNKFNDGTTFTGAGTNLVYYGTVTLNGAISSENLEFGGATIIGNGVLSGVANWTSGDLGNGTLAVATNGALCILGSATKGMVGTATLINQGLIVWSGTNDIQTANSARIINQAGALFDIANNQSLTIYNGGAITNLGTIRKSAGGGGTLITVPLYNFGTLDVQSGSVSYGSGSQFHGGSAFTGVGTNRVYAGTVTFNGAISSANLELGGATIAGNGVFSGVVDWTGGDLTGSGVLTVATNGVLNIKGSGTKGLGGTGALINYGSIAWSGTNDIQTFNSARISNQPGALFDIQNNQLLDIWNGGAITNLGTIRKSAGGGTTTIRVPFYDSGTLDVQIGTIAFVTYSQTGGKFSFGLNSLTNFGRLAFNNTITFNGTLAVNLNGGYSPTAGDAFTLITYPSRSGAFASFDLPSSHAWQANSSIYGGTVLTLSILNTRPSLPVIAERTTDEQVPLTFTITGTDPDTGQSLAYTFIAPPSGATNV